MKYLRAFGAILMGLACMHIAAGMARGQIYNPSGGSGTVSPSTSSSPQVYGTTSNGSTTVGPLTSSQIQQAIGGAALATGIAQHLVYYTATGAAGSEPGLVSDGAGNLMANSLATASYVQGVGGLFGGSANQFHVDASGNLTTSGSGTFGGPLMTADTLPTLNATNSLGYAGNRWLTVNAINGSFTGKGTFGGGIASGTASNTDLAGELALSGGTATYTFTGTYSSHPICTANDETSITGVRVSYTGTTSVTFSGTTTDTIGYICVARN